MNIKDIKDLMAQFDQSSLKEFSYRNGADELSFSKNEAKSAPSPVAAIPDSVVAASPVAQVADAVTSLEESSVPANPLAEGDVVESPLVGVAYLAPAPDKPSFVSVGDTVKKGQTLLIIEAMKVMNEVPAPRDGVVTEILVSNEEVIEFGKGLVRLK
ncbi:acetyl-CoA carboxylase biotin carboxyl carrier protein [Streptococcus cuniculipharyngis]|uniref:Biotin carboxyl carrier protein of acetyl-CoA carboxylase n=1 Tax=Streptococcus cuniculipharyngis TaxID=1562651 RepID=A0A5C5SG40_9STRE|nr:acetyl-CoA carboxylase biotin carboxyl carrier protein [Streptococcus cuniculipharyngis]TWS99103.1 acetyl-CoA carboxylase biotin carboxyl carrier protein [Streptococcus cuniculipharyngis]